MLIRRVARPMLAATFITRGVESLRSPKPAADAARPTLEGLSKLPDPVGSKVPADAETVAKVTAGVQISAGLLLATGRLPRVASAALAFSVVPGSLGAHAFWNETDPERKATERRALFTDIGLIGGLVIAAVDTEGKPSLGWRGRRAARQLGEAVTDALPSTSTPALIDDELVDRVGSSLQSGLHAGAERGRELAAVARDRGAEWVDQAREHGPELTSLVARRGGELADAAAKRGAELADIAAKRSSELADRATRRGAEFADVAGKRGSELADVAAKRGSELADAAAKRGSDWADTASKRGADWVDTASKRGSELAEAAQKRSQELADVAAERSAELTKSARKTARKEAKRARKELRAQTKRLGR